ncbi:Predicted arabinose efflux permease, MFS family [Paenibacillus algorifonticola]|uniref:Predicted arabinose efflux permease, MFS family n=1 Tax=Paenibacillus algorifonticola TaxID=684063 RepID=A0A1I1YS69_9BACL|nr:MFS transporter [Paenibacillus algorifonticola]SFE22152.1 Predicted arabinose efflux permease, MFS family [Paenibacillus algorifonticola]
MNNLRSKDKSIPNWLMFLLAAACGLIVANLYYAQTLIGPISASIGIPLGVAGLIVTLTQVGYVIGLLFIVPLSDLIENRRLVITSLVVVIIALIGTIFAPNAATFLVSALFIGIGSVAAQILVPYATFLAADEERGRVVGNVMSGLLLGIMFARPLASLVTEYWGWRAMFIISAVIITLLSILLSRALPQRKPSSAPKYGALIVSLGSLFKATPVLRRRAFYQASLFGSFSLFWTVMPLRLAEHFKLTQQGIALFALAGVAGAVAAPIAGRLADRGWTKWLTGTAIIISAASFVTAYFVHGDTMTALVLLLISAIVLDMGVSGNLVLGQRAIYSLGNEVRGRLNGLFMAIFFIGGAVGSFLGGWAYAYGGWKLAALIGISMPVAAFIYYLTELKSRSETV